MSAGTRPARLVSVRWRPFRLPLRHRFEAAHGVLADRAGVLIELRDADGNVGLGEASPMPSLGDGTVEDVLGLIEEHAAAIVRMPDEVLAMLGGGTPTPTLAPSEGGGRSRGGRAGMGPGEAALAGGTPSPALAPSGGGGRSRDGRAAGLAGGTSTAALAPSGGGGRSRPGLDRPVTGAAGLAGGISMAVVAPGGGVGRSRAGLDRPVTGAAALACGLDTALLDLEGQQRGVPVARLLSEQPARAAPVNAVVGSGSVEETVAFAAEAVAAGYETLKFKVGTGALDDDVARIAAVRRAHPAVRIRLDANGAWTEAQAIEALGALARLGVELIEQPVRASAVRALGRLRRKRLVAIAADEALSEAGRLDAVLDQRAADLLVLKPMRLGGPRRSIEIARRASEAGIPSFVTTTFDSSIGTAAALHVAAALGTGRPADGLSTVDHLAADLVTRPLRPRGGVLRVPAKAGLGVALREAAVERLATGPWVEVRRRR